MILWFLPELSETPLQVYRNNTAPQKNPKKTNPNNHVIKQTKPNKTKHKTKQTKPIQKKTPEQTQTKQQTHKQTTTKKPSAKRGRQSIGARQKYRQD